MATSLCLSLLFLFVSTSFGIDSNSSSCPIDLSYVRSFPWDKSACLDPQPQGTQCCQALYRVFGIGTAQHLKETSSFQLPNPVAAASCLSEFKTKLAALSINPSLVTSCIQNSTQFVSNTSSCAGIITTQDWVERVGPVTVLDTACKGDVTGIKCRPCIDAGTTVLSHLVSLAPNSTKCYAFIVLYAIGVVNEFGPEDPGTVGCILGLPATTKTPKKNSSRDTLLKVVFSFLGAFIGVLLACTLVVLYRKWDKKKKGNAHHKRFVNSFKASVLPNWGAKWFCLLEP